MTLDLATLDYRRFEPSLGVPVRTSNGAPRYRLGYQLQHVAPELIPPWPLVRADLPASEFADRYRAGLDQIGLERILDRLHVIAAAEGGRRLVLLCFDDLSKPGMWCHRRIAADWLEKRTGLGVPELGPTEPDQSTLF